MGKGNVGSDVPVHSVRIRVGRSIQGFGLSPGITKDQRVGVENLMKNAFPKFTGDLAGSYYALTGMDEKVRQQLVDDRGVLERLARGIKTVGDSVKAESGKDFQLSDKFGYIHSCPTNLGTGMRASVHVDLPGWTKEGLPALQARCEELSVQPRGTRGESGGQTGHTYDISNKHRLGHSEVALVQTMIDGVNTLWKEDMELCKKHGM